MLRLSTRVDGLGAEFFRWEFATAVAGAALGINPFDEPNVSEAKEKTKALLGAYATSGRLPEPAPSASSAKLDAYASDGGDSPAAIVRAALRSIAPHDYVAFLSYLPADADVETRIDGDSQRDPRAEPVGQHVRRRPAVPALDRAVPQGRTEHGRDVRDHRRGRCARRRSRTRATRSQC